MDTSMISKKLFSVAVLALAAGVIGGYLFGQQAGYKKGNAAGYARAEADVKNLEEGAAKKAAAEATKAANPFQGVNPLQGVESNPFEKAKKLLNPF